MFCKKKIQQEPGRAKRLLLARQTFFSSERETVFFDRRGLSPIGIAAVKKKEVQKLLDKRLTALRMQFRSNRLTRRRVAFQRGGRSILPELRGLCRRVASKGLAGVQC
jgi:hypothetical protein